METTAAARPAQRTQLDARAAAWLALVPTTVIVLSALVLAGPWLGRLLFPAHELHTWRLAYDAPLPERTEHARFLIALTAPLVLTATTVALARRPTRLGPAAARRLAIAVQLLAGGFVLACVVAQRAYTFHYAASAPHVVYFTVPTLAVAAAIAAATWWAIRAEAIRRHAARLLAESRRRRLLASLVALGFTILSLSVAVQTDATIAHAPYPVAYHLAFTYDEALAVLDGRSPLGDFAAQYASLWPYLPAGVMALTGPTLGAFTIAMAVVTGISQLALFDVLRRLTRSSLLALALFLSLLATSLYMLQGPSENRFSLGNYFGTQPLRYAGPFLLLWAIARHLQGAWPRRAWPLFLLGGLVAINNLELGTAALGATVAALLWARPQGVSSRDLGAQAALGLAAASALVTALVLLRTGALPNVDLALRYPRLFGVTGFAQLPMRPIVGLSTVMYLTYVAAIGAATVRTLRAEPDRLLTGLLAWSGIFGLGAGSYYIGRSSPEVLTNMFPAWALAVTLLTVLVGGQIASAPRARPSPAQLACLFAFGITACSLAQTPTPWSQARRLDRHDAQSSFGAPGEAFVQAHTRLGEPVAILTLLGHKTAVDLGLDNTSPYTGSQSIKTREQLDDVVAALRASGGDKVFVSRDDTDPDLFRALLRDGFAPTEQEPGGIQLWRRSVAR